MAGIQIFSGTYKKALGTLISCRAFHFLNSNLKPDGRVVQVVR